MRFAHTNIASKDWKKLTDFYVTVFDCKIKSPQRKLSGTWLDKATGLTGAKLEGVHLYLPGHSGNPPTLEIFTYESQQDTPDIMPDCSGITHIAFEVDDVHITLKKALANGASKLGEIVENEIEDVGIIQVVYFRDPEGNIIEIQSWKQTINAL